MKTVGKMWTLLLVLNLVAACTLYADNGEVDEGMPEPAVAAAPRAVEVEGDKVSLSFVDARIQDVFRSLAASNPAANIMVDPNVTGTVTLDLEGIEWNEALNLIAEIHGLTIEKRAANLYYVRKPQVETAADITVELYTASEIQSLSDEEILELAEISEVSAALARERIMRRPGMYVKRLAVENRPAIDVINVLARKANLNYAFSADLRGAPAAAEGQKGAAPAAVSAQDLPPISLNLRNLAVEEAIKLVAGQGGLTAVLQNGVWVVSPLSPAQRELEPLKLETFHVNFIPLDDELVKLCQNLVTDRGVVTRGKNKILLVKDTAEGIEAVRQALLVMDKPTPQVLIEARFFQVTGGLERKLGIDWQDVGGEKGASFKLKTPTDLSFEYYPDLERQTKALTAVLEIPDFEFILHALRDDSNAKELANPKLVVNSDEQATIHIGEQTPILRSNVETTDAGSIVTLELDPDYGGEEIREISLGEETVTTGRTYTTNKGYLDLGTKLTVLPSVKTEEEVYIRVAPELMSQIGQVGEGTQVFPKLFRTYVRTQFTVRSGQTIAIGGLVSERETNLQHTVPVLGSIPLLGRLFRYDQLDTSRSETIIFLTVKVIAGKDITAPMGVPIRAYRIQPELDRIEEEDAAGAVYDPEKARKLLEKLEREPETGAGAKLKARLRQILGMKEGAAAETAAKIEVPDEPLPEAIAPVEAEAELIEIE